ncbi:MAG: pilus assembly protein TadG-related protein [Terracidiphilus sp.]
MTSPEPCRSDQTARLNLTGRLKNLTCRLHAEQNGQILPWMALLLTFIFFGLSALVVDIGRGIVAYHMLQSATDSAVLAAAQTMPTATTAAAVTTVATDYSAVPGNKNANPSMLPNARIASGYPKYVCLSTVAAWGVNCTSALNANAVQIQETIALPTIFAGLIGFPTINISATSTAAMRGSPRNPYNVAIVIDTTGSMGGSDGKTSNCYGTRISCALEGTLTMLGDLSPCAGPCGTSTNGNVAHPLDEVSIYAFPGLADTASVTNDTTCPIGGGSSGTVNTSKYVVNSTTDTTGDASAPYYQLTGFDSDYASADPSSNNSSNGASSSNLQTSSILVQATGGSTCSGIQSKGGAGTYFAAIIYQAQYDLAAQQAARLPTQTQNVMVILSDGDATAGENNATSDMSTTNESINIYNTNGTYPSFFDECQQAVTAAESATAAGTTVYTVAYGTQSSGCDTDQSGYKITSGATTYTNANPSGLEPCQVMQQMASSAETFYSDFVAGGNGGSNDPSCTGASGSDTSINDIFAAISGNLSTARLIPNNTD